LIDFAPKTIDNPQKSINNSKNDDRLCGTIDRQSTKDGPLSSKVDRLFPIADRLSSGNDRLFGIVDRLSMKNALQNLFFKSENDSEPF
jgi:hypothetical protein